MWPTAEQLAAAERLAGDDLLAAAAEAVPGWSEPYGGSLGVARTAAERARELHALAELHDALRAAAIAHASIDLSYAQIGDELGVSKTAVSNAARRGGETWARHLAQDVDGRQW